jgi:hypothetical protein
MAQAFRQIRLHSINVSDGGLRLFIIGLGDLPEESINEYSMITKETGGGFIDLHNSTTE